jgi:hypothetical protein
MGNEYEILSAYSRLHFPVEEEGSILKIRFCLTTMNPQVWLGRHQVAGLNY